MARIRAINLGSAFWLLFALKIYSAPYQEITADIPPILPPGIKDSTLIAWGPPMAGLSHPKAGTYDDPVVWMRITVGQGGRAKSSEVVYSSHPAEKLDIAAKEAVKKGLFYAVWDGPNPVTYTGYYPVMFSVERAMRVYKSPDYTVDWEALREFVGRDGPIVEPTTPVAIEWPTELRDSVSEAIAWLKVRIDRDGSVERCKPFFFLRNNSLFDQAAVEAASKARFPVKLSGKRSLPYDAYVAVPFVRTSDFFAGHGLPRPEDILPEEQSLRPLDDTVIEVLPSMDRAGMAGTVRLRLLVDTSGKVLTSRIDSSSGFVELDRLAHVRSSALQYKSAGMGGAQSPVWTSIRLSFAHPSGQVAGFEGLNNRELATGSTHDTIMSSSQDTTRPDPGEFQALDRMPEPLHEERPKYPRSALQAGIQGKVIVWGLVDKDGRVIECKIARSSGFELLDNAGVNALLKYKFRPGVQNGRPVKCWVSKGFTFKIN